MTQTFDVVVIGSGSAAQTVALRCRAAGRTVAMIDKRPFGGTCALRGCDPKKVLVTAAAAVDAARLLSGKGVHQDNLAIHWTKLIAFKRSFTEPHPAKLRARLAREGVVAFEGVARFVGPAQVTVGDTTLESTQAIVIATGARPVDLGFAGHEHLITSDQFLDLASLPASMAFVGGGYISFEFAHVAFRAGARVVILHRDARPLAEFDAALVDRLIARTRLLGVEVRLNSEVQSVGHAGGRYQVSTADSRIEADLVVHGAGRIPDLDGLALDAGGIRASKSGVAVNQYLQSVSNPRVYAAGDCADTDAPALTPVAGYEGRVVATNVLEGNRVMSHYEAIPSVAFTVPPLARVGLREEDARAKGLPFVSHREDTSTWHSSRRAGEPCSGSHMLVDPSSGTILGAHLLGPAADETINLFALAMRAGVTADRFKEFLWAYPTHASDASYMLG